MTHLAKLTLAAALTLGICSGSAVAQSTGNTDPAKANTTDPNSTPTNPAPVKAKKSTHHAKKHHKTM